MTIERICYVLLLISGVAVCLAALLSAVWHKLESMNEEHWDNVHKLAMYESGHISALHASEMAEFEEIEAELRDVVVKGSRRLKLQDATRVVGLVMFYVGCILGGLALVILGGEKTFT